MNCTASSFSGCCLLKRRASCLRSCKLTRKLLCLPILSAGQLRSIHLDATAESKAVEGLIEAFNLRHSTGFRAIAKIEITQVITASQGRGIRCWEYELRYELQSLWTLELPICASAPFFSICNSKINSVALGVPELHCLWP